MYLMNVYKSVSIWKLINKIQNSQTSNYDFISIQEFNRISKLLANLK